MLYANVHLGLERVQHLLLPLVHQLLNMVLAHLHPGQEQAAQDIGRKRFRILRPNRMKKTVHAFVLLLDAIYLLVQ
jgi:hypothetical protein